MSQLPIQIQEGLEKPFTVSPEQISFFKENGFIKLKNVLSPAVIQYMNETISSEVVKLNTTSSYGRKGYIW